jgi:diguanylate cyclase (GGDEF)-like protein
MLQVTRRGLMVKGYRKDIFKVYAVIALSCVLLALCFYLFGFRPLVERLHQAHGQGIQFYLGSGHQLLHEVLENHRNIARQMASRTIIRKEQIRYLRGEIDRAALAAFSREKLADGLTAHPEIAGITRYDPQGRRLYSAGVELPEELDNALGRGFPETIQLAGPATIGGISYLLYASPIVDHQIGPVGYDILMVKDERIQDIISAAAKASSHLAIARGTEILYWPADCSDAEGKVTLLAFLQNEGLQKFYELPHLALADSDWKVFAVVDTRLFFADLHRQKVNLIAAIITATLLIAAATVLAMGPMIRRLLAHQSLLERARLDGLTGLYNQTWLASIMENELERAHRYQRSLSLVMFDVDRFKEINDTWGHLTGDQVLQRLAGLAGGMIRTVDCAARYGGDEFILVLPETGIQGAKALAERLRRAAEEERFAARDQTFRVTISVGVLEYVSCDRVPDWKKLLEQVDQALYASKAEGRNRVTATAFACW